VPPRFLPAILLLAAAPAPAQSPGDTIVVTGRGLGEVPGEAAFDVVTLPRERLETASRLEDVLRDVPGFQLFRRSDASSANPTSQGVTLRALGGNASSRALILLDGVPQTDPFGGWVSWPAYDPQRLAEVRVRRGGGSGVDGPGALAGTIALESVGPAELDGVAGSLLYGSRDSLEAHAGLGERLGAGFLSVTGAYARGDGFVPVVAEQRGPVDRPSPYQQASVAVRAVAPLPGGVELQASGLGFTDRRERGTALSDISTDGADASLRLVARRWSALAYVQTRDFYNSFASANAARTAVTRTSEQYNVPSTGLGARFEWRPDLGPIQLRLGGDWRRTDGVTRERFAFVAGTGTRRRQAGGRTDTLGAFVEADWVKGPLTLVAGGRLDRWDISRGFLEERVFATGALLTGLRFPDRAGWEPTGRLGLALRAAPGVTLRSAAYAGWRLPTLNELYRPFRAGTDATGPNPGLKPERLKGVEAGFDWSPAPGAKVSATLFANRLEDPIANVTLGFGPGIFPIVGTVAAGGVYRQRQNLDAISAHGVELDAHWKLGAIILSGGWSWVDAKVRASGIAASLDGLRPAQTPRSTFTATLAWRGRASLTARYVSGQYEDDLNRQLLPGALTFDAESRWPLTRRLALEARAENIADRRVYAGINGDGIIERATPRTLWIGLRFGGLP
jgi:outer membrane receptor protein involved in Fe transport